MNLRTIVHVTVLPLIVHPRSVGRVLGHPYLGLAGLFQPFSVSYGTVDALCFLRTCSVTSSRSGAFFSLKLPSPSLTMFPRPFLLPRPPSSPQSPAPLELISSSHGALLLQ